MLLLVTHKQYTVFISSNSQTNGILLLVVTHKQYIVFISSNSQMVYCYY